MGVIADLVLKLRHVLWDGVATPDRSTINFIGGTVADNPVEGRIDVTIGSGVASLGVTAPILNTGTATAPVVAISAATTVAVGSMKCAGDLGGTGALPSVLALRGCVVGTAGGALAVGGCLRVTGGATCDWGALDLANASAVTGVLPKGNQGVQDMLGDVTGSTAVSVVAKVNGTTVNAGGALAVGQVLRATGAGSAQWGAVDLAAADAVTGTLPTGNQADQTMAGDVSGSTGANTVDAIRETTIGSAGGALATGAVLRVTGASTCDWGAVDLADGDAVTGVLPVANVEATATPTALKIVKWDASVYLGATRFYGSGTVATAGLLAAANNVVVASARNAANSANIALLTTDGTNKVTVGDASNASGVDVSALTTLRTMIGASVATQANEDGLSVGFAPSFGGGRAVLGLVARSTAPTTAPTGGVVISNAAGSVEVWTPGLCKTTLNPEINAAPTSVSLPRYIHKTHTSNATITAALITITLPTASSFSMTVKVTAQVTTTDTRAHYKRLVRGGRGGAGASTIDDAATIGVDFDAITVAAVPTIASDGAQAITIKVTGKAATEIDWWIMVDDCVIYSA